MRLTGSVLYLLDQQVHDWPQGTAFAKVRPRDDRHPGNPVLAEAVAVDHCDETVEPYPGAERMSVSLSVCEVLQDIAWLRDPRVFKNQPAGI